LFLYGFDIFYLVNFCSQTHLDSDDFGCNFSTTGAYPNGQEGETPADKTVEYRVKTDDELNLKQFAQSTSTATPFECECILYTGFLQVYYIKFSPASQWPYMNLYTPSVKNYPAFWV
jgi:hypothetical protein